MLHKQEAPRLVTEATSKAVQISGLNAFELTENLRERQAHYVLGHWQHVSVPVANVVAELHFQMTNGGRHD